MAQPRVSPTQRQFSAYLRRLQQEHFATVKDLAAALGVNPTHVSRAMADDGQPFGFKGLFRLAEVTGEHPATVLQKAGKGDLVDLIESTDWKLRKKQKPEPSGSWKAQQIYKLTMEAEQIGDTEVIELVYALLDRSVHLFHASRRAGYVRPKQRSL